MKKKILFVIDSLNSGGAEKSLISLLTLFDYSKYKVDLLMFQKKGLFLQLLPEEVNVLTVPEFLEQKNESYINLLRRCKIRDLFIRIVVSISLRCRFITSRYHNSQINWFWNRNGLKTSDVKYDIAIAYSQGMPTYYVSEKVRADKKISWLNTDYNKAKYNKNFDYKYYRSFNNIVTISEACRKAFEKNFNMFSNKIEIIEDIVSQNMIQKMANQKKNVFKEEFVGVRLLTIGRLEFPKGYELAIEAAYKLKKMKIKFKWYVLGEGTLEKNLRILVKQRELEEEFIFLGVDVNPYPYIKECDIYVQTSKFEGKPIAISEAKILKKPIVVTNFPTVFSQIENGINGLIVNMDSDSICRGIASIINDIELRNKLINKLSNEKLGNDFEIEKLYNILEK